MMNEKIFNEIMTVNNAMKGVLMLNECGDAKLANYFNITDDIATAADNVETIGNILAARENGHGEQFVNRFLDTACDLTTGITNDDIELAHRMISGVDGYQIKCFYFDSLLAHALYDYYEIERFSNLTTHIRDGIICDEMYYFVTGMGYATIDEDLLGGCGNNQHYEDFLAGKKYDQNN